MVFCLVTVKFKYSLKLDFWFLLLLLNLGVAAAGGAVVLSFKVLFRLELLPIRCWSTMTLRVDELKLVVMVKSYLFSKFMGAFSTTFCWLLLFLFELKVCDRVIWG